MKRSTNMAPYALLPVALLVLGACSIDANANPARGCDETCPVDKCHKGFCFAEEGSNMGTDGGLDGSLPPGDGGINEDGGIDDIEGTPCDAEGDTDPCYLGPAATKGEGVCRTGERTCTDELWSACVGEVRPQVELCNGKDDDCNGAEDDGELMLGSCRSDDPLLANMKGECRNGLLMCERGTPTCVSVEAVPEICDDKDNDCDGETDEGTDQSCFEGDTGCELGADGVHVCHGICQAGMRACSDGVLSDTCAGQVLAADPEDDVCTSSGIAADDDCDDQTDEECTCVNDTMQDCYRGPGGTLGVGECAAGTQTCADMMFGSCEDETVPAVETCANQTEDNDCDGDENDIPMFGDACTVEANKGICRNGTLGCNDDALVCITPEPEETETCNGIDDNCDGDIDEAFDFQTDSENCGECGTACPDGTACCGGGCVNRDSDEDNCGACDNQCGSGLTCCGGGCVNTITNASHCATCFHACPALNVCRTSQCRLLL